MKREKQVIALVMAVMAGSSLTRAATTGWNKTAGGTYDYGTTANWADSDGVAGASAGDINGIWDSTLTLAGAQFATFSTDPVLTYPLSFGYAGNYGLTFYSSSLSVAHTLTLGGDISVRPASNQTVTFGDTNYVLNVDLGGTSRTFDVGSSKNLTFINSISNGSFTATGGGTVRLYRNATATNSDIAVSGGSTLLFEISTAGAGPYSNTRAKSVTLNSGTLSISGHSNASAYERVNGAVTFGVGSSGFDFLTVSPNASTVTQLAIGSLARADHGVGVLRGTSLGAAPANGVATILLDAVPTGADYVGGDGSAHNHKIIPWVLGGTTTSDAGSSFVTYHSTNGIRPLDTTNDYDTNISGGTSNDHNVRLADGSTITADGDTTINSLFLVSNGTSGYTIVQGTGKLTVTSGAVYANVGTLSNSNALTIAKQVALGNVEGVFGTSSTSLRTLTFSGGISGSAGLTVYQTGAPGGVDSGVRISAPTTYTGDTVILGNLMATVDGALPSGTRIGNVYVYGNLSPAVSDGEKITMNGLYGTGTINHGHSQNVTVVVGDNNADGDFSGMITGFGKLHFVKIGTGTQILRNNNSTFSGGSVKVSGGALQIGSLTNEATVRQSTIANGSTSVTVTAAYAADLLNAGAVGRPVTGTGITAGTTVVSIVGTTVTLSQMATANGSPNLTYGTATPSAIGQSTTDAGNIMLDGGTLKYTGGATSTNRLFQVGTTTSGAVGTLESSGSGEIAMTNTGAIAFGTAGATNTAQTRTLVLTGSNTGNNTLSALIGNNGTAINGNSVVSVTKNDAGTWILTGNNTYTGNTTINAGKLVVNGVQTASAVKLNGGTLGGSGSIGSLDVAGGATVSPGNSPGILSIAGSLMMNSGSHLKIEIGGDIAGNYDQLNISGAGDISGASLDALSFLSYTPADGDVYYIVARGGGSTSTFANYEQGATVFTSGDLKGVITYAANWTGSQAGSSLTGGNDVAIAISTIPEPAALSLALTLGLGLLSGRRRRLVVE